MSQFSKRRDKKFEANEASNIATECEKQVYILPSTRWKNADSLIKTMYSNDFAKLLAFRAHTPCVPSHLTSLTYSPFLQALFTRPISAPDLRAFLCEKISYSVQFCNALKENLKGVVFIRRSY